jgi:hypothetical protein
LGKEKQAFRLWCEFPRNGLERQRVGDSLRVVGPTAWQAQRASAKRLPLSASAASCGRDEARQQQAQAKKPQSILPGQVGAKSPGRRPSQVDASRDDHPRRSDKPMMTVPQS